MKRTENIIIALSIILGLLVGFIDALVDYLFFYRATFWELLLFDVPAQEVYARALILVAFALFGIIVSRIVHRRRRAEEQIRDLGRFRSENPYPVLRVKADATLLYANAAAEPVLGDTRCRMGELLSGKWRELTADALKSGSKRQIDVPHEGSTFSFVVVPVSEAGYVNWYGRDVTERRQAEKEKADLSKFPSENPNPVLRVSRDGTILYANMSSSILLEFWGRRQGEQIPEQWQRLVLETFEAGCARQAELECRNQIFSLTFAPVANSDYLNVYGLEITARKQAELELREHREQLEELVKARTTELRETNQELVRSRQELVKATRLAAIGQVSASIAHDLRNPLGAARNAIYYLRHGRAKNESEMADYLEIIDAEIGSAERIISKLLEMAKAREPTKQAVDLGQVVDEVFDTMNETRQMRCRKAMCPEPFVVKADPDQLRQVVGNLLSNAVHATQGRGEFLVEATRGPDGDTIVFRDTGPGITPEIRQHAFEPLVTNKSLGTGLGLTICRDIVQRHGGSVETIDHKQGGAAFRVRLPRG